MTAPPFDVVPDEGPARGVFGGPWVSVLHGVVRQTLNCGDNASIEPRKCPELISMEL